MRLTLPNREERSPSIQISKHRHGIYRLYAPIYDRFMAPSFAPEKYLGDDFFQHKYVAEVSAVTGNYDLIIKIQCENLDQFNDFLQEFREKYGKFLNRTVTMVCTENLV